MPRAAIWNGTPESVVDLSDGRTSRVTGMAPGIQVGWASWVGSMGDHAAVWHGTPESFTDFNPPGVTGGTKFLATTGRIHVGQMPQGSFVRAAINFGTPDSWLGLHQFLPPQYPIWSEARAVCQDGDRVYVGGWAENGATGRTEAVLWIGTLPCWANCDGSTTLPTLNVADFTCFLERFLAGDGYANCDRSATPPVLNIADFTCFLQRFAGGCQ